MKACELKLFFVLICVITVAGSSVLHEKFSWREVEFIWPSNAAREEFLQNGDYVPANNLPMAFDVWRDKAYFIVPRFVNFFF